MRKILKQLLEWAEHIEFLHKWGEEGAKWLNRASWIGSATGAIAMITAFFDGWNPLWIAIAGIGTFGVVVFALGAVRFALNQVRTKPSPKEPPDTGSPLPTLPKNPLPPGAKTATENNTVVYLENSDRNHISIINNYYGTQETTPGEMVNISAGNLARLLKEYSKLGVISGTISGDFPQPARIKIAPESMELLDATANVSSIDREPQPDGSALISMHYGVPIQNPSAYIGTSTTTSTVSVTGTTATFKVEPRATVMDVMVTGTATAELTLPRAVLTASGESGQTPSDKRGPIVALFKQVWESDKVSNAPDTRWLIGFIDDLRQAGVDAEIDFWGRSRDSMLESAIKREPLVPIPHAHWNDFKVQLLHIFQFRGPNHRPLITDNNFGIGTEGLLGKREKETFADLYVDKAKAQKWFEKWKPVF
jgi:hypothetical protein